MTPESLAFIILGVMTTFLLGALAHKVVTRINDLDNLERDNLVRDNLVRDNLVRDNLADCTELRAYAQDAEMIHVLSSLLVDPAIPGDLRAIAHKALQDTLMYYTDERCCRCMDDRSNEAETEAEATEKDSGMVKH